MKEQFQVIIIEDERLAAARLEKMLTQCDPAFVVIAWLTSIQESVQWLRTHPAPDLVFLDLHLDDGPGSAILEQINIDAPVVVISAFDEHVLLSSSPLIYFAFLTKPVFSEELCTTLQQCKTRISH
jgi:response regulator of citrate/malate metabolism